MDQNQRLRASPEQFSVLIEYMERHGDLSRPQAGSQGRLRGDRLWGELTSLLNSIGGGVEKTQDKWKKVWADWKTKTKKKYMLMRRHASGTGGGPSIRQTLTALEERVVAIIGVAAVIGHSGIQEQGFNISSQPLQPNTQSEVDNEPNTESELLFELPDINIPPPPESLPLEASSSQLSFPPPLRPTPPQPTPPRRPTVPQPTPPRRATPPRRTTPLRSPPRLTSPTSVGQSPHSVSESPRRRLLRPRRNRGLTPFDRAVSEFVAIENQRLRFEETRNRRQHELEVERLRLEAQRIDASREQNQLLRQLAELLGTLSGRISLPSTEQLSESTE